jgi:serine/threonine protein kinase
LDQKLQTRCFPFIFPVSNSKPIPLNAPYNKHDCILKKISNTDSAQYELLQTKYLHKIMPEYTLPVYKTSHTKQHVFMLMPEYGVSLYDFMTGRGAALREFEIKEIYKKVGLALHKLHDTAGLSHLDIKEENILIDPDSPPGFNRFRYVSDQCASCSLSEDSYENGGQPVFLCA